MKIFFYVFISYPQYAKKRIIRTLVSAKVTTKDISISALILNATCLLLNLLGSNLVKIIYFAKLLLIMPLILVLPIYCFTFLSQSWKVGTIIYYFTF